MGKKSQPEAGVASPPGFAKCRRCGKEMNPVDALVGSGPNNNDKNPICGPCTAAAHSRATRGYLTWEVK